MNNPVNKWTNELYRKFSMEEVQMGKKHMKKCSKSLAIKRNENQNHIKIPPHSC
jgi:hypothetical protein